MGTLCISTDGLNLSCKIFLLEDQMWKLEIFVESEGKPSYKTMINYDSTRDFLLVIFLRSWLMLVFLIWHVNPVAL